MELEYIFNIYIAANISWLLWYKLHIIWHSMWSWYGNKQLSPSQGFTYRSRRSGCFLVRIILKAVWLFGNFYLKRIWMRLLKKRSHLCKIQKYASVNRLENRLNSSFESCLVARSNVARLALVKQKFNFVKGLITF